MHPDLSRPPRARPRIARYVCIVAAACLVATGALIGPFAPAAAAGTPTGPTWTRLSPPTFPRSLEDAAAAYDKADQTVVLFGGRWANGHLSDQTWVWNGSDWAQSSTGGSSPPARAGASMAFDARLDQLILFGGEGAGGQLLDDTWAWNGASWTPVTTTETPGGREGAALASDTDGHLILFGGYGITNGSPPPPTTTTTKRVVPPRPRHRRHKKPAATTTTTAPKKTTSTSTTTTTVPPESTTTTTPTSTAPSTTSTTTTPAHGPNTSTTTGPAAGPASPGSTSASGRRTSARLTSVSESTGGARVLGDTWILSRAAGGGDEWTQAVTRIAPPPRADAALSEGRGDQTILFGGTAAGPNADPQGALRGDTWIWNGQVWSKAKVSRAPAPRMLADLQDTVGPGGLGNAVLFGGLGARDSFNDTWLWDGHGWQHLSPGTPASARSGAAAAYDQMDAQYIVFGGRSAAGRVMDDTQVLTSQPPQRVVTSPAPPTGGTTTTGKSAHSGTSGGAGGGSGGSGGSAGSGPSTGSGASSGGSGSTPTPGSTLPTGETKVHRGGLITLYGAGFKPHAMVTITLHSKVQTIGEVRARADGSFLASFVVPADARLGAHHFVARGLAPNGLMHEVRTAIDVLAVGHSTPEWAKATMVAIAIAIPVASWFVLGLFSRRRRIRPR